MAFCSGLLLAAAGSIASAVELGAEPQSLGAGLAPAGTQAGQLSTNPLTAPLVPAAGASVSRSSRDLTDFSLSGAAAASGLPSSGNTAEAAAAELGRQSGATLGGSYASPELRLILVDGARERLDGGNGGGGNAGGGDEPGIEDVLRQLVNVRGEYSGSGSAGRLGQELDFLGGSNAGERPELVNQGRDFLKDLLVEAVDTERDAAGNLTFSIFGLGRFQLYADRETKELLIEEKTTNTRVKLGADRRDAPARAQPGGAADLEASGPNRAHRVDIQTLQELEDQAAAQNSIDLNAEGGLFGLFQRVKAMILAAVPGGTTTLFFVALVILFVIGQALRGTETKKRASRNLTSAPAPAPGLEAEAAGFASTEEASVADIPERRRPSRRRRRRRRSSSSGHTRRKRSVGEMLRGLGDSFGIGETERPTRKRRRKGSLRETLRSLGDSLGVGETERPTRKRRRVRLDRAHPR